jgi:hypothetical protein
MLIGVLIRVAVVAWALWLGATAGLFVSVAGLFRADRNVALSAAPILFQSLGPYRLALAAVCASAAVYVYHRGTPRPGPATMALLLTALSMVFWTTVFITPVATRMAAARETQTPEFRRLHALSSSVHVIEAITLLLAATPPWRRKQITGTGTVN